METNELSELYRLTFGTDKGKTRAMTIQKARKGLSAFALGVLFDKIIASGALSDTESGTVNKISKALDVTEARTVYDVA